MNIELLIIIGLCLVIGVVLAGYDKVLRELNKYKKEKDEIGAEAREKAVRIMETARDKAVEIVADAKIDSMREISDLEKRLSEVSEVSLEEYKQMLQNISKTVENTAVRELSEFKKTLELETMAGQKAAGAKLIQELDDYKKQKMAELEKRVSVGIKKITLEILGKSITTDEHTTVIMAALEKAKNEGLFD